MSKVEKIYYVFETFIDGKRDDILISESNAIQMFLCDLQRVCGDDDFIVEYKIDYESLKETYLLAKCRRVKNIVYKIRLTTQSVVNDLLKKYWQVLER